MTATNAQYLTGWLGAVLDGKSPRTREGYRYVVNRLFGYLEAHGHPTDLAELRPMHLRTFFAELRAANISPNTLANFDRTLRAIFNRIEREGRDDFALPASWKSPLASVDKQRPLRRPKQPLTEEQAKRLLAAAPRRGFLAHRNYAMLAFMLMSGARSIEVRHATVAGLNLDQRVIDLRITKGSKQRYVFLPMKLARILSKYLRVRAAFFQRRNVESPYLFPTRDGGVQERRALHRAVRVAGERIGIPKLGPHRLRHSFVSLSHARGAPLVFLQQQCGHSSVLVTQGYITLSDQQRGELADRFSAFA